MHLIIFLIGCLLLTNAPRADDSWTVEFVKGSGWDRGFQIVLENTNRYDYIEHGFSESGECTGVFDPADFRSIRTTVNSVLGEQHPVQLTKPEGACADETTYYIKVRHGQPSRVAAEYGFSSVSFCRADNFPDSVYNLAIKLERLGPTKLKGKCLKEMALNPPNKPGFGTR